MRSSSGASSTIVAAGESPTTSRGQVVGRRPQTAGGDDHVDALAGQEAQRPRPCPRAGRRTIVEVGEVDAALAHPLGQPRPVAVGDDPREDLGAGDDDAGAGAHAHVGPLAGRQRLVALGRDLEADRGARLRQRHALAVRRSARPTRCRGSPEAPGRERPRRLARLQGQPGDELLVARVDEADVDRRGGADAQLDRGGRGLGFFLALGLDAVVFWVAWSPAPRGELSPVLPSSVEAAEQHSDHDRPRTMPRQRPGGRGIERGDRDAPPGASGGSSASVTRSLLRFHCSSSSRESSPR